MWSSLVGDLVVLQKLEATLDADCAVRRVVGAFDGAAHGSQFVQLLFCLLFLTTRLCLIKLELRHLIVSDVLVEGIEHGVDVSFGATVAIGGRVAWLGPFPVDHHFVLKIGKRRQHGEKLL